MSKDVTGGGAEAPVDDGARSFGVFLAKFAEGTLNAELSETLREAVKTLEVHAADYGKAKGTITLTLTLAADRDRDVISSAHTGTANARSARRFGIAVQTGTVATSAPRRSTTSR